MADTFSLDIASCRACGRELTLTADELAPDAQVDPICWPCDHGYTSELQAGRVGSDGP